MSKIEVLMRYNAIIKKLKQAPSTLKEIANELAMQADLHGYELNISNRTFQRDVNDIRSLYQVDIEYDFTSRKYHIKQHDDDNLSNRILEAFDTLNALNASVGYASYLDLEKRKPLANDHFHGILHAIKNKLQIAIHYQSYWNDQPSLKNLEPYLLKEFKNRWYLIANDIAKNELRTYGLDRIVALKFGKKKFTYPTSFSPETHFRDSFGVIRNDSDKPVQEVLLSFDPHQGKYIKSLPLHSSQEIVTDTEDELVVKLKIYVTFDFVMELLSYGPSLEVLAPPFLRETVKNKLKEALLLYR